MCDTVEAGAFALTQDPDALVTCFESSLMGVPTLFLVRWKKNYIFISFDDFAIIIKVFKILKIRNE